MALVVVSEDISKMMTPVSLSRKDSASCLDDWVGRELVHAPKTSPSASSAVTRVDAIATRAPVDVTDVSGKRVKILQTESLILLFVVFTTFVALGGSLSIVGPTLTDLGYLLGRQTKDLYVLFVANSIGYVVGTLISLISYRVLPKLICMFVASIGLGASLISIAFWRDLLLTSIGFSIYGLFIGVMDVGVNTLVFDIWMEKSHFAMQIAYFGDGFGSLMTPLLSKFFVSRAHDHQQPDQPRQRGVGDVQDGPAQNATVTTATTRASTATTRFAMSAVVSKVSQWDDRMVVGNGTKSKDVSHANERAAVPPQTTNVGYVYALVGVFALFIACEYGVMFAVRNQAGFKELLLGRNKDTESSFVGSPSLMDTEHAVTLQRPPSIEDLRQPSKRKRRLLKHALTLMGGIFLHTSVALYVAMSGFIVTFAENSWLEFTVDEARYLDMCFLTFYSLFRLITAIVAGNVRSLWVILWNLAVSTTSLLTLVCLPYFGPAADGVAFWVACCSLGIGLSNLTPAGLVYIGSFVNIDATVGPFIFLTIGLAPLSLAPLISTRIDEDPMFLIRCCLYANFAMIVQAIILAWLGRQLCPENKTADEAHS